MLNQRPAYVRSLPQDSMAQVFVVPFVSATLLPQGSRPVVFVLILINPNAICLLANFCFMSSCL
jgi:membrane protein YqaA with SNARE-associated domain